MLMLYNKTYRAMKSLYANCMAKAAGSGCLQVHVNVEENVTKPVILFFYLVSQLQTN